MVRKERWVVEGEKGEIRRRLGEESVWTNGCSTLLDWQWPSWAMLAVGAAHGTLGTVAHLFMARALAVADASFCMPFDFTRLPLAAAMAFFLFGQVPDAWTIVGGAVIFAAGLALATRRRGP